MGKRTDLEQNQRLAGTVVFVGTAGSSRNLELASRSEEVVDLAVEVAEAAEAVEVVEAVEVAEAVEVVEPVAVGVVVVVVVAEAVPESGLELVVEAVQAEIEPVAELVEVEPVLAGLVLVGFLVQLLVAPLALVATQAGSLVLVELLAETLERLRSPTLRSRKKHQLRRLAVAIQRLKLQSPLRPLR